MALPGHGMPCPYRAAIQPCPNGSPDHAPGFYRHVLWTAEFGGKKARLAATGLRPPGEKARDLLILKEVAEAGTLRPVVDGCYPMDQIAEAHRRVETGHKKGHVIVQLDHTNSNAA